VDFAGTVTAAYAEFSGLTTATKVFGGAADNAAGAEGAGNRGGPDERGRSIHVARDQRG